MRKVGYFIDSDDPGGAETLIIELSRNMPVLGYTVEVYHFGNSWLERKCNEYNIPCVIVPGHNLYKSSKTLLFFCLKFSFFLRHRKIDVLHSHLYDSIIAASVSTFISRTPHIGTLHDVYTIENSMARILMLKFSNYLGTKLVAVSDQIQDYLKTRIRFSGECLKVIRNGVNIDSFSGINESNLCKELNLDSNDYILICVGRLVKLKAHAILFEAVRLLNNLKINRTIKLLVVGDGPEKELYNKIISENGLTNNVIFLGQRDDVAHLLRLSDCFVMSSLTEGLSCSIIEAMAAGLPIIVTNVGGNSELVKDGENGYLVPVNDPIEFSDKISDLISDDNKRIEFGKKSFSLAKENYSLDAMLNNYIELYDEISH